MSVTDSIIIWWHAVRGHMSAYAPGRESWLCQCGERRGHWRPGSRSDTRV
jgi:hypothetical protein